MSFKVYIDGIDVFDLDRKDKVLKDTKISDKLNEASSFSFKIPPMHEFLTSYHQVHVMRSTVLVEENGNNIFAGRASEVKFDFNKDQEIYCEGQLSYFNDSLQPPAEYDTTTIPDFLRILIDNHNKQVEPPRQFEIGNVTFSSDKKIYRKLNYETTMDCLKQMLLQAEGGYLFCRYENGKNYIDYLEELTDISNQPVEFGVNMQDLSIKQDGSSVYSELYVKGTQQSTNSSDKSTDDKDKNKYKRSVHIPQSLSIGNKDSILCTYNSGDLRDVTSMVTVVKPGATEGSKELINVEDGATRYVLYFDPLTGYALRSKYSESEYIYITVKDDTKKIIDHVDSNYKYTPPKEETDDEDDDDSSKNKDTTVYYASNPVKNDLLISLFGPIAKVYDLGDKWGSQANMKAKAEEWLEKHKMDYLTIEATGIDLSYLDRKWDKYKMSQVVYIRSMPHDINTIYAITSMETDLNKQQRIIKTGTEQNQDLTEITKQETKIETKSDTTKNTKYVRHVHIPKTLNKNSRGRVICTYDNGDTRDVTGLMHTNSDGTQSMYYDKTTGFVLNNKNTMSNELTI